MCSKFARSSSLYGDSDSDNTYDTVIAEASISSAIPITAKNCSNAFAQPGDGSVDPHSVDYLCIFDSTNDTATTVAPISSTIPIKSIKCSNPLAQPGGKFADFPSVDYLCILDFEATCNDEGPPPQPQEIIEFPAILLDVRTGEIEKEFHHYIKPDVHPTLSAFCTELTGITQRTVEDGISLDRAMALHQEWIDEKGLTPDHAISNKSTPTFVYVTDGDWDLKTCLPRQLLYHSKSTPFIFKSWINIKWEFSDMYGTRAGGLTRMLWELGLELEGRLHSGIDDCRNIARLCQHMLNDGWVPGVATKQARSMIPIRNSKLPRNIADNSLVKAGDDFFTFSGVDYLCILDFEATCNHEKKPAPTPREIIEFPALLLNVRTGEVEREFHHYIKPDVHPTLSGFCTQLTGITQSMVDGGITLGRALVLHQEWINEIGLTTADHANNASTPTFLYTTCGDWDLKVCLPSQLKYHSTKVPRVAEIFQTWMNIKHEFKNLYGKRAGGMTGMLWKLGLELRGSHHSGIDGCRNIVRICQRMLKDGWVPGKPNKPAHSMADHDALIDPGKHPKAQSTTAIILARNGNKCKKKERSTKQITRRTPQKHAGRNVNQRKKKERSTKQIAKRTSQKHF